MRLLFGLMALLITLAVPADAARMSAWVPSWDPAALEAMRLHAGKLDEANPGWYTMGRDGGIVKNWGAEDLNMRAALSGTALVPTIKNYIDGRFDGAAVATVIATASSREAHANALADLVVQNAYAGIDVDYEKVPTTSRDDFSAFITLLASKLHARGAILSVTVHAKTGEGDNWNGPGGQDWPAIGQAADSVKIMAYDYHWSTSGAGPIAPLAWLDRVAGYAESAIPAGKVIIGLPWYGYDWSGTTANSVTYSTATATALQAGVAISRDENGEATYSYSGRTVYFQDATSYKRKVEYIQSRHGSIAGFAHWRVGAEDPAIWDVVATLKGGTSGSTPARPAGDFIVSGPSSLEVVAGRSVSGSVSIIPIDGFAESVSASVRLLGFVGDVTLSKSTIAPNEQSTLTVTPSLSTAAGTYQAVVTMTGSALVREMVIDIRVSAPVAAGDFTLASVESMTVVQNASADVEIALRAIDGFSGTAALTVRTLTSFRGSLSLSSSILTAAAPVRLTIAADKKAEAGQYFVEIVATSGSITRSRLVEVTVPAPVKRRASGR